MDVKSLKNCRKVSKSWWECIDNQNILWKNEVGTKAFQLACKNGHSKMVEMLFQKSTEYNIDYNAEEYGDTAFHFACENGQLKIAEMLILKSNELCLGNI